MSDENFALPPFDAMAALSRLKRELREQGLTEREGRFERRGQTIARVAAAGAEVKAALVKRPGRSPEWQPERSLKSSADVRDFVAAVKAGLARWNDSSD